MNNKMTAEEFVTWFLTMLEEAGNVGKKFAWFTRLDEFHRCVDDASYIHDRLQDILELLRERSPVAPEAWVQVLPFRNDSMVYTQTTGLCVSTHLATTTQVFATARQVGTPTSDDAKFSYSLTYYGGLVEEPAEREVLC